MIQQHSHFILAILVTVVLYFTGWIAIKLHYFDSNLVEAQRSLAVRSYFYHYRCRDGASFTAVLPEVDNAIKVVVEHMPADDNTFWLPHVKSEFGRVYSRGGMTLAGQGEDITFTYFGTTTYCNDFETEDQPAYNFGD